MTEDSEAFARARILVADDDAETRALLLRLLRARWRVESAEDGEHAWEALTREGYDLVLTDV